MREKVRQWLRGWLGMESDHKQLADYLEQRWRDTETLVALEKEQSHEYTRQLILVSQGFVPLMNERITALEASAVNGPGVEAIANGIFDQMKYETRCGFDAVDKELAALNKRLIDLETRNVAPVERPPDVNPAGSWTAIQNQIDASTLAGATNGAIKPSTRRRN